MITIVGEEDSGTGRSGRRMAELFGVDYGTFSTRVNWVNLFDNPNAPASVIARTVEQTSRAQDAIILLGRRVAHEFMLDDKPALFQLSRNAGAGPVVLLLPHPSGLNRWWNDEANTQAAEQILRDLWRDRA